MHLFFARYCLKQYFKCFGFNSFIAEISFVIKLTSLGTKRFKNGISKGYNYKKIIKFKLIASFLKISSWNCKFYMV